MLFPFKWSGETIFWLNNIYVYLGQILLAQGAVGVVVQAALQASETESVTTGSGHRLIEQSGGKMTKRVNISGLNCGKHIWVHVCVGMLGRVKSPHAEWTLHVPAVHQLSSDHPPSTHRGLLDAACLVCTKHHDIRIHVSVHVQGIHYTKKELWKLCNGSPSTIYI